MNKKIILSLFDLTGNWSKPWEENGYQVIQVDIQLGTDILTWDYKKIPRENVYGILAAIPCTDYALSGARHFARKDNDGTTEKSQKLVEKTKEIIDYFEPTFWVVENPMSRIHKLNPWLGEVKFKFNPCDFAGYLNNKLEQQENRYNKQTWLWGKFNNPISKRLEPLQKESPIWKNPLKLPYESIELQNWRSRTPMGFAYAFYEANKEIEKLEENLTNKIKWKTMIIMNLETKHQEKINNLEKIY